METHTLNGIKYVSRLITQEENTLIDKLRNDELGCLRCELSGNVGSEDLSISIREDKLHLFYNTNCVFETTKIQISFCPFCGKPL